MMIKEVLVLYSICFVLVEVQLSEVNNSRCESKSCEEFPKYPTKILNTFNLLWPNLSKEKRSMELQHNSIFTERKLCESQSAFIRPQKLKNVNEEMKLIVNHQNFTQIVRFETCSSENFPCTYNIYPKSVKSHCRQNYSIIQLLAYDENQNCLKIDQFKIPSSCECIISNENDY
ncbi:CLUMA_CG014486, isoform A [Clunio marinus]|uniref:CLUMA_CG014486, isoform A n=1 Tax=Clunio marinus TaxID=568069 RepID=A0A1J1IMQ3_9DIPT|nr:CLUMA_CG014486, isoform A [Clunio marinus]